MSNIKEKISDFFYKFRYGTIMLLMGLIVAFWDLLTKSITDGKTTNVINGVLSFFSSHNTGAAWSILSKHTWLLIAVSILFIVVILIANWFFKQKNYFYAFSVGLILSGAMCNLFDRIVFGYVRDFISLDFISFPIFNIADIAITVGVIMLCVYLIVLTAKEDGAKQSVATNQVVNGPEIEIQEQNQEIAKENKEQTSNVTKNKSTTKKSTSKKSGIKKVATSKSTAKSKTQVQKTNKSKTTQIKSNTNTQKPRSAKRKTKT